MKNHYYLFAALCIYLSACKTVHEPYRAHYKETTTEDINNKQVIQTPVVANLDVSETKATGTFSAENVTIEFAKNKALADAIAKAGADILVEPVYEVDVNDKVVTVTVQGYPGKYKNFRQPEAKDSVLLQWYKSNSPTGSTILKQEKPHFDQKMMVNNVAKCDAMLSTGRILTYTGISLLASGSALVVGGAYYSKNEGEDQATIPMIALGGVITAAGVFLVPFGVTLTKKAQVCRKFNGNMNTAWMDFNPHINALQQQYAMGVTLHF